MTYIINKFFNHKKYLENKENKKKLIFKKYFFSVIKPVLIKNLKILKEKKEVSFLHSGHLGDVINSLPLIKEISKKKICKLYIEVEKPLPKIKNILNHPSGNYFINNNSAKKLLPLLKSLKYLNKVDIYNKQKIDINLNFFREMSLNFNIDSVRWYFHLTGIHADLTKPYVQAKKNEKYKNSIVIMRSLRRQNPLINYNFLNKYKNLLFLGLYDEFLDLKKNIKSLKYYDSKSFLELASIIKSCRVFIGNLSFGYALAEAIKCKRLLESGPNFPLIYPNGENAYDFYYQEHFENLFKKIYSIKN